METKSVNIDIRPGSYNAAQLSTEIQRAINAAYGDDKKYRSYRTLMIHSQLICSSLMQMEHRQV